MLATKPQKGVFYNTTPFSLVEAQIHAQLSTTFATLEAVNGSYSNAITGLKWSITSGNEDGYFSLDEYTGVLSLINDEIPLAGYELNIKVQDAVNTTTGDI
jgi:hypothetical protein